LCDDVYPLCSYTFLQFDSCFVLTKGNFAKLKEAIEAIARKPPGTTTPGEGAHVDLLNYMTIMNGEVSYPSPHPPPPPPPLQLFRTLSPTNDNGHCNPAPNHQHQHQPTTITTHHHHQLPPPTTNHQSLTNHIPPPTTNHQSLTNHIPHTTCHHQPPTNLHASRAGFRTTFVSIGSRASLTSSSWLRRSSSDGGSCSTFSRRHSAGTSTTASCAFRARGRLPFVISRR
jgi:hypothetical protein